MCSERRFEGRLAVPVLLVMLATACGDDNPPATMDGSSSESGDGDGDGTPGDGDGAPGDGDGSPGDGDGDGTPGDGDGAPIEGQDYRLPGPHQVTSSTSTIQATAQCNLEYGIFTPDQPASDIPVLLAHGFMRSIDNMAADAEHLASWGLIVYTVPLCTNSFSIDHQANGEAMAAMGETLAPNGAIYSGFSAGGLAAFIAANTAANTVAFVGLDPVDSNNLGLDMAAQYGGGGRASIGEPGQCNTNNNFLPVFEQLPSMPVIRIVGAQHFDFETDACGGGDIGCSFCAPAGPDTHALALGMTTAAALLESGADPGGATWWTPGGTWFDMFAQAGEIAFVQ